MLLETFRVLWALPAVELARLRLGPTEAIGMARRLGVRRSSRDASSRARLGRLIGFVDRHWPTGPNCYRRVLLEMALDGNAAREALVMGFRADGGTGSGHAWIASQPPPPHERYDAVISV